MHSLLLILVSITFFSCAGFSKKVKESLPKLTAPDKALNIFKVAWARDLDPVYNTGNLPIGTSAPFIYDDILYMGDLSGNMTAFDLESGRTLWTKKESHPIQSKVSKVGDNIFYGTKLGRFFARNYLTGELKYSTDLGAPIESGATYTSGRLLVHLRDHTIVSVDAQTGKVFWKYSRSIPYTTTLQRVSQVLPYQNKVIVGFADGSVVSLTLAEGVVDWEQKISTGIKFVDVDVTPLEFEGVIVVGSASGPVRFLSATTGAILRTIEISQSSHPLIDDKKLILGSVFGEVARVGNSGKIELKKKLTSNGISSIAPWKNGYIVTTMGPDVFYIDKVDFSIKDHFNLGSEQSAVFGDIALGNESMSIYSSRNRLYVFR